MIRKIYRINNNFSVLGPNIRGPGDLCGGGQFSSARVCRQPGNSIKPIPDEVCMNHLSLILYTVSLKNFCFS